MGSITWARDIQSYALKDNVSTQYGLPNRWWLPLAGWMKLNSNTSIGILDGAASIGRLVLDEAEHWIIGYMQNIGDVDVFKA